MPRTTDTAPATAGNASLDDAVFAALLGSHGSVLGGIWRAVLRTHAYSFIGGRAPTTAAVGRSLRRLQSAGRVFLHDGRGTLAIWKSTRGVCWSTREDLIRAYGYENHHFIANA